MNRSVLSPSVTVAEVKVGYVVPVVEAAVRYSNCSPSRKEPLSNLTSTVPSMYASAPVVVSNETALTLALAPVFKPLTSLP